eukprot:scaffold3700_cov387-Prasinococcus_capsulatus_cf.AAC.6
MGDGERAGCACVLDHSSQPARASLTTIPSPASSWEDLFASSGGGTATLAAWVSPAVCGRAAAVPREGNDRHELQSPPGWVAGVSPRCGVPRPALLAVGLTCPGLCTSSPWNGQRTYPEPPTPSRGKDPCAASGATPERLQYRHLRIKIQQ